MYKKYKNLKQASVLSAILFSPIAFASCGKHVGSDDLGMVAALAALSPSGASSSPVSITFQVADDNTTTAVDAFSCAGTMTVATRSLTPRDLRFWVSELKLVKADLTTVDVTLDQDGVWQYRNAALLDWETGDGSCNASGTTGTHKVITGSAPSGDYIGVQFTLGLPQSLNMLRSSDSPAPLNTGAMYWSWTGGYKFTKVEFLDGATATSLHVGSTGCTAYAPGTVEPVTCAKAFRGQILVTDPAGFDPTSQRIVLNLNTLFLNFATATGGSCMPGDATASCQNVLTNMGLNFNDGTSVQGTNSFEIR
jgi:uncharacterized repeat protein (TIGR04052 family)